MPAVLQDQLLYAQPLDSHTVGVDGPLSSRLSWKRSSSFLTDESHSIKDHAKTPMVASFDEAFVNMPNGRGQRLAWQKASSFLSPVVADTEEQRYIPKRLSASTSFNAATDATEYSKRTYDLKNMCLANDKCKHAVEAWCREKEETAPAQEGNKSWGVVRAKVKAKPAEEKSHMSECTVSLKEGTEGKLWEEPQGADDKLKARWEVWSNRQFRNLFLHCEPLWKAGPKPQDYDKNMQGMPGHDEEHWEETFKNDDKMVEIKGNWNTWFYKDACKFSGLKAKDTATPCVQTIARGTTYCDQFRYCVENSDLGPGTRCGNNKKYTPKADKH